MSMAEEYNNIVNCIAGLGKYYDSLEGKYSSKKRPDPIGFSVLEERCDFSNVPSQDREEEVVSYTNDWHNIMESAVGERGSPSLRSRRHFYSIERTDVMKHQQ